MPVVAAGAAVACSSGRGSHSGKLEQLLQRIRLNLIPFSAHDVYQISALAYHSDVLGLMNDADVMRGLSDAFENADQNVLTPFQLNLITDTFRQCGIHSSPKEVMIPEEDAISPESLLDVLRAMNVARQRDETKLEQTIAHLVPLLDEFSPTQLSQAIVELVKLDCPKKELLNILAKRVIAVMDELGALDISLVAMGLSKSVGVSPMILRRYFTAMEPYYNQFQPEDFSHVLTGLKHLGPSYLPVFTKVVEFGLDQVENMDGGTLTHYLVCFVAMSYRERTHIEIYADALVNVATDLTEAELVQTFVALDQLHLLTDEVFELLTQCLCRYAVTLLPRHVAPVIDVCSRSSQTNEALMTALMNRMMECVRFFTPHQLAEAVDLISLYPPAKSHPMVPLLGQQGRLRVEIMGSIPLAMLTRGLANLGYTDAEFYALAMETGCRYGFKDWSQLAPIARGLVISGGCSVRTTKILASFIAPMTKSMPLPDVMQANRFLCELGCEEDFVFRSMATRVLQFVKEVTPDMPEDLQLLLQRGATLVGSRSRE